MNDFIDRGRIKKVYIQGEPDSRVVPEDINRWYVRNQSGEMVSFGAFLAVNGNMAAQVWRVIMVCLRWC